MTDTAITDPFADHNEEVNPLDYAKSKFKKADADEIDVEKLARGKYESDRHISTLEAELADLRKKAELGMGLKEFYEAIRQPNQGNPPNNQNEGTPNGESASPPVDITKTVQEELNRITLAQREEANKKQVVDKLAEVYGANASAEISKAASALGLPVSKLNDLAKESPAAFFRLTGLDNPVSKPSGGVVPTGTVNLPSHNSGVRNQQYYQKLRKENPKLYNDPKTQAQELRDALELKERFFQ